MAKYVLCVDIGTTSLKAGIFTDDGEVVFFSKKKFSKPSDRYISKEWMPTLKKILSKTFTTRLDAISISGNGPTVTTNSGLTVRWNENLPFDKSLPGISLFMPKILALKENFAEEFHNTQNIFSGPEFLIYELTGKAVTVLPEKRFEAAYWNNELLQKCEIPVSKMPPFVAVGELCGYLTEEAGKFLEIDGNIPVFSGGPDFVAALIGTDTLKNGMLCDRCGSSEGLNFCIDKFVLEENIRTLPSVIPGLWNASYLIPDSSKIKEKERIEAVKKGITTLKAFAEKNGFPFPAKMSVTGGQAKDRQFLLRKAQQTGMDIHICNCVDSELLGDLCAALVGLEMYKDINSAAEKVIKTSVKIPHTEYK